MLGSPHAAHRQTTAFWRGDIDKRESHPGFGRRQIRASGMVSTHQRGSRPSLQMLIPRPTWELSALSSYSQGHARLNAL